MLRWFEQICRWCGKKSGFMSANKPMKWTCLDCADREQRIRGGALAMSRFLTFVWMEAESYDNDNFRADVLREFVEAGRVKVSFP